MSDRQYWMVANGDGYDVGVGSATVAVVKPETNASFPSDYDVRAEALRIKASWAMKKAIDDALTLLRPSDPTRRTYSEDDVDATYKILRHARDKAEGII